MFKTNEEIIVIQAKATAPIPTEVVFWSHDKGTAKMLFQLQKDYVNQTLSEGTIVPICLDFVGGRHIYHAVIEDAVNGIVSIVLEDNILGYQGRVDGSIYIELPDSRSLDTAGRFTFDIKRSPIDLNTPELDDYYWQGFNEIMNQYHQTIAGIETESERLLNELQARILTLEEKLDNVELRARFKTAWSWSVEGTDRFTTVYPNENLVVGGWELGGLAWNTGKVTPLTDRIRTVNFIKVEEGDELVFSLNEEATDLNVVEYGSNYQYVGTEIESTRPRYSYQVRENVVYLRFVKQRNTDPSSKLKVEQGDTPTIYTTPPSNDPINAYPTYKGISIVDSDNPADYSWQAEDNTIAKKATLDSHTENISNPHKVTKTQVGLGNVDNYSTATQAEAEAGAATNKFMTPVLVFKAIAKWVQGKFVSTTGNETVLGTKNFQDGLQVGGNPAGLVNDACWCEDFAVNNLAAGIVNPDIQRFSTSNAEAFSMIGKTITVKKAGVYLITLGVNYTGLSGWLTFGVSRADGTSLVKRSLLESANSGSNSLTYVRSFEGNDQLTIEFNSGTAGTTMQKINLAIVKLA
ncbi:BppU family phage baseplate upper protein [Enterococcus dongliensis]|uniref:BppU family phage baseplate upper protein n=1 Tax=Enterococcus dongliensis TaxID=2559925 RepID=UPI002891730B|nr:BppU family phage baseplate upper protein [Enterococcus dongliensis]MDT2604672.1 BppU family phage baseplate upper protein [Enterococcus dongliensis]MDT2645875.1 BppU family phage baseplate upper protein [Enterococcus dongliensis]MDT2712170.1 BppU family phage baseplate upper protein [Enterococcus dongliensis]